MSSRWDEYFLNMAMFTAHMSKDPSTKVGAVLTSKDRTVLSTGYNGFPRNVIDSEARLNNREVKLELVVHAEMNAVLAAARIGTSTRDSVLYVAATDGTHEVWGGPPCVRCTVECMQAGVVEFVSRPMKLAPSRWYDSIRKAKEIILEAGLKYREIPLRGERWCHPDGELACESHIHNHNQCRTCPLHGA